MTASTILIVDDNPPSVHALVSYLHGAGFKTMIAPSGERALMQLERATPDLILLDVLMPEGLDGFELCKRLKKNDFTRDIPVIFMTSLSDTENKVSGFEVGGADYLTKPLQHEEVLARVNTHLSLQKSQQQLHYQNDLLEEQNARFRKLSEATFEGIVVHDRGDVVEVNQAFEKMLGRDRSQIIGRNILEWVAESFRDEVMNQLTGEDVPVFEAEAIRHQGEVFPVEIQVAAIPYQGRSLNIAAIRDISWRRRMEQEKATLEQENRSLRTTLKDRYKFGRIIGKSPAIQDIYELISQTAVSEANVIILGESGTGKELVAETIHHLSNRKDNGFVSINCGAISESLFESSFFGHRKGAFTGADKDSPGFLDRAHAGTMFLDEVGELPTAMQVKLLRVLENGEYIPVGDTRPKHADLRIIAATNKDVDVLLQRGEIRKDFYYRINVITLKIPPLRERREDIPLLVEHFLAKLGGDGPAELPGQILDILGEHDWPGNVRELQNALQRYLTVGQLNFGNNSMPTTLDGAFSIDMAEDGFEERNLYAVLNEFERRYLTTMLEQHHWNKTATAKALGITRRTLHRLIAKLEIG